MVKVVLLTGAGANYPLGLSTTKDLFDRLRRGDIPILQEKELFNVISQFDNIKDIEDVWYNLENIEEADKLIKNLQFVEKHFYFKLGPNLDPWSSAIKRIRNLKRQIEDIIFQEYTLPAEKATEVVELYKVIISYMKHNNRSKNKTVIPIFTTNYDRVLDEVGSELINMEGFKSIDGFERKYQRTPLWNPDVYSEHGEHRNFLVFQLHGSLKWRRNINGKIEKLYSETPQRDSRIHPHRLIIYPGSHKNLNNNEPYLTMHQWLREYLKNAEECIVVGFSFRDDNINEIFVDSMKNNSKLEIINISPNAQEEIESNRLFQEIKKTNKIENSRLRAISCHFEKLSSKHLK